MAEKKKKKKKTKKKKQQQQQTNKQTANKQSEKGTFRKRRENTCALRQKPADSNIFRLLARPNTPG